ncbi:MAG: LysM peptidoglycan-binding domain-containing M23 family metallopeptidase [Candidatus Omnitrophota bacterium]
MYFRLPLFIFLSLMTGCATVIPALGPPEPPAITPGTLTHTVQQGETLWRISKMYHVDLENVVTANRISDSSVLKIGQALVIPTTNSPQPQSRTSASAPSSDFTWPMRGKILVYFNEINRGVPNKGMDISAVSSQDVCAARPGRVVFIGDLTGYGTTIVIDHKDGFSTIYGGLTSVFVKTGEDVEQKKIIAKTGRPPRSENGALHFQIRKNHKSQNPLFFLSD